MLNLDGKWKKSIVKFMVLQSPSGTARRLIDLTAVQQCIILLVAILRLAMMPIFNAALSRQSLQSIHLYSFQFYQLFEFFIEKN